MRLCIFYSAAYVGFGYRVFVVVGAISLVDVDIDLGDAGRQVCSFLVCSCIS